MTFSDLFIACATMSILLAVYYVYWGIKTFSIIKDITNSNKTLCEYLYEKTDAEKWSKRNKSNIKNYFNKGGYSITYAILGILLFLVAIAFIILIININNSELGSSILKLKVF